jgi:long-chain acyl-CoA synthetase
LSIHWPIIRRLATHPTRPFIVDDTRTYTGARLLIGALVLADAIDRVSTSRHIAVALPSSGAFPIAALAGWITGRVVVPVNFLLKKEELQYILDDAEVDTLVTAQGVLDFMGYTPDRVKVLRAEDVNWHVVPEPRWPAQAADDDLGVLLYTSGTSGRPKGVMLTHGNITANIRQCQQHVGFDASEVMLGILPQFHTFGLTVLTLMPLTIGARAVFMRRFMPGKVIEAMREHKVTAFIGIPSMYNALAQVRSGKPEDLATLRYAVSGGEPLPAAVAEAFMARYNVRINEGYGMTELSPVTNWCRPQEYRAGSVGPAVPEMSVRIVDIETGHDLGPGLDGEIRLRGPNLMRGYFKLPEATAAAFDQRGHLRSGDIGRTDRDGHLYITGRLKEMLIIAGENVFPREIEEALNSHPAIKDSGVVGAADPMRGEVAAAFVELKENAVYDEQSVYDHLRARIAGFKLPKTIRVLEALPRNATGKVMRRELKKMV